MSAIVKLSSNIKLPSIQLLSQTNTRTKKLEMKTSAIKIKFQENLLSKRHMYHYQQYIISKSLSVYIAVANNHTVAVDVKTYIKKLHSARTIHFM